MEFNFEEISLRLTLLAPMLGTVPKNKEVYKDYILAKAEKKGIETNEAQELQTIEELDEKAYTGFHQDETGIFIYNYMIKGNIKTNMETLIMARAIEKIAAYKTYMDRILSITPRKLRFNAPDGRLIKESSDTLQRSLRVMTMQGPRVSLAKSDIIGTGCYADFTVRLLENPKIKMTHIKKCLAYGEYHGIGQWRGSGEYGRYSVLGCEM